MENSKNPITLIGVGIVIGGFLVWTLISVFGAIPRIVNVGPIGLEIPTVAATVAPRPVTQATHQVTEQPVINPTVTTMLRVLPTPTPALEFVYREATGGYVTKKYDITLGNGEVIAGQGYGFQQQTGGCVAYLIKGPGRFTVSVTDGAWLYYKNVTTVEQVELLLQNQIDSLSQYGCTPATVKVIRLP